MIGVGSMIAAWRWRLLLTCGFLLLRLQQMQRSAAELLCEQQSDACRPSATVCVDLLAYAIPKALKLAAC